MYINFVFFCILNLGKIIQIVSHHESDSDQSTESGWAVQRGATKNRHRSRAAKSLAELYSQRKRGATKNRHRRRERQQSSSIYATAQPYSYLNNNSLDDSFADYSFNDNQQPPAYIPAKVVIDRNPKLLCESKVSTLALKLARESFFGEAVMLSALLQMTKNFQAFRSMKYNFWRIRYWLCFLDTGILPSSLSHCGSSAPSLSGRDAKDLVGMLSDSVHSKLST